MLTEKERSQAADILMEAERTKKPALQLSKTFPNIAMARYLLARGGRTKGTGSHQNGWGAGARRAAKFRHPFNCDRRPGRRQVIAAGPGGRPGGP